MKPKKLRNIITKVKTSLEWQLQQMPGTRDFLQIVSDPDRKRHTVLVPKKDAPDLDFLHELGHAVLCEKVHPLFSTSVFVLGTPLSQVRALTPVMTACQDWFVDGWLRALVQSEFDAEMDRSLAICRDLPDFENRLAMAVMSAQDVYFRKGRGVDGLAGLSAPFLAVPPDKPSAKRLEFLVNRFSVGREMALKITDAGLWKTGRPEED